MNRRDFSALFAMTGVGMGMQSSFAAETAPEVLRLSRNGWMPNNELLPVFIETDAG